MKGWKKTIREDRDWDFTYIWKIELTKLRHLLKYWENYRDEVFGKPKYKCMDTKTFSVIRDLKWAIGCLEIMVSENGGVWDTEPGTFHTEPVPDRPGLSRLVQDNPEDPGKCTRLRKFNMRNAYRFFDRETWEARQDTIEKMNSEFGYPNFMVSELENDARLEKARHLYHKIRLYRETRWWE